MEGRGEISFDDYNESASESDQFDFRRQILDEEKRREAQAEYRKIFLDFKSLEKDKYDFNETLKKLETSIHNQNACLSKFGVNELVVMDAKNMSTASELTYEVTGKLENVHSFDKKRFIRGLKARFYKKALESNMSIDTKKKLKFIHLYPSGFHYRKYHYSVPAFPKGFKPDCNDTEVKTRKVVNRKALPSGQATQPTEYDSKQNRNNVDESDKRMEHIFTSLKKLERRNGGAVPFLQASFNPNNFALTVENIFNMAFLVRQSRIAIDSDNAEATSEPTIQTKEQDEENDDENPITDEVMDVDEAKPRKTGPDLDRNIQSVFSLDMASYKKLLDKLDITRPAIK